MLEKNWTRILQPMTWDAVVGQSHLVSTFQTMLLADNFPNFSIFAGPTGVGKSCMAELVAKSIVCTGTDKIPCNNCQNCKAANAGTSTNVIKYDMPNLSEEDVVTLINNIFKVDIVGTKVFIIEEAHVMDDKRIQTKWLEPLTKIPPNVYIIFCTTHLYSLIPPIRNRARVHQFEVPSTEECLGMIENMSHRLGFELPDTDLLMHFIKTNRNSPRGIIGTLESFANSAKKTNAELRELYRMQDAGVYHKVFCSLIDNSVSIYNFIQNLSQDSKLDIPAVIAGLKDYVMRILLELSLGTDQGIQNQDKLEIQRLLATDGDKLLLKITSFLGGLTEYQLAQKEEAMFKLISLKLELLNLTNSKLVKDNLSNASTARMTSLENTVLPKEDQSRQPSSMPSTAYITNSEQLKTILGE